MTGHYPDDRERDRRHDDQRHQIAAELGHDQHINQHQTHRVGSPHVAEGLVGDLPFTIPLDGVGRVGIVRLMDEPLIQRTGQARPHQWHVLEPAADVEHAVEG